MTSARTMWWFTEAGRKDRAQAIGLRLAVAYHLRDAEAVASLLPENEEDVRLVMGALEDGLVCLNQFEPPGPPDEVWEAVTPIIDAAAPPHIRPRSRAMLALSMHAMRHPLEINMWQEQEKDPQTSTHLFAAITAMRAHGHEGSVERMLTKANELDPQNP